MDETGMIHLLFAARYYA